MLSLAYDGLVAYRRVPGVGGSTIVPDLATSVPEPTDGGRTYTFQLRLRPALLRRHAGTAGGLPGLDRAPRAARRPDRAVLDGGIVGAKRAARGGATSSKGIETDAAARTIVDPPPAAGPEFMHKLAIPLAVVLPSRAPTTMIRGRPPPGTGPYTIAAFTPRSGVDWSAIRASAPGRRTRGPTDSRHDRRHDLARRARHRSPPSEHGRADAVAVAGVFSGVVPVDQGRALALADAEPSRTAPEPLRDLPVPQRPRAAVRRRASPAGAELRGRSPPHGRARRGQRRRGLCPARSMPPGLPGYVPHVPVHRRDDSAAAAGRRRTSPAPAGWSRRRVHEEHACVVLASAPRYAAIGALHRRRPAAPRLSRPGATCCRPRAATSLHQRHAPPRPGRVHALGHDFLTSSSFFDPLSCRV